MGKGLSPLQKKILAVLGKRRRLKNSGRSAGLTISALGRDHAILSEHWAGHRRRQTAPVFREHSQGYVIAMS
jgi:hypothetical protein